MSRRTLRLSQIPRSVEEDSFRNYLNNLERQTSSTKENILAFSLAPYIDWLVATVTFDREPSAFFQCSHGQRLSFQLPAELGGATVYVDCDFYGITPLHHPQPEPEYE